VHSVELKANLFHAIFYEERTNLLGWVLLWPAIHLSIILERLTKALYPKVLE